MDVQIYAELPESETYYINLGMDDYGARLFAKTSAQFNDEMEHGVIEKKNSPADTLSEIRRVNRELLVMLIAALIGVFITSPRPHRRWRPPIWTRRRRMVSISNYVNL